MDGDVDGMPPERLTSEAMLAALAAVLARQRGRSRPALDGLAARLLARELEREGYCLARSPAPERSEAVSGIAKNNAARATQAAAPRPRNAVV